jgi:diguanylate cyclase (GGDEF)-like protein
MAQDGSPMQRAHIELWQSLFPGISEPQLDLARADVAALEHELADPQQRARIACACAIEAAQRKDMARASQFAQLVAQMIDTARGVDPLTGLLDHGATWKALREEHERAVRHGRSLCLVLVDLAHFKLVNDTLGHLNGDQLLVRIAQLLRQNVRGHDVIGRVGGDEFVVLMTDASARAGHQLMRRLQLHVRPMRSDGTVPSDFDVSYGLTDQVEEQVEEMFRRAERQLYTLRGSELSERAVPLELPRLGVGVALADPERASQLTQALIGRGYDARVIAGIEELDDSWSPHALVAEARACAQASGLDVAVVEIDHDQEVDEAGIDALLDRLDRALEMR